MNSTQFEMLQEIFSEYDEDWLLSHVSVSHEGGGNFVIRIENVNEQDVPILAGYA